MDLKEIQNLIKFVAKSKAREVKIEMKDFKITIRTDSEKNFIEQPESIQPDLEEIQKKKIDKVPNKGFVKSDDDKLIESDENLKTIKSPMIGTFYRKASSDKEVFVEVGEMVNEGDVLCVIEAMKLFNEIESDISGKIVKVLVDDASPVEFEQPLFLIETS